MEVFQENYFENERKVLEGYWRRRWRFATRNLDLGVRGVRFVIVSPRNDGK